MAVLSAETSVARRLRTLLLSTLLWLPAVALSQFAISPTSFDLKLPEGATTATVQLFIRNDGEFDRFAAVQPGVLYIAPEVPPAVFSAETVILDLPLDIAHLEPGYYYDTITITEETPAKLPAPEYQVPITIEIFAVGPPVIHSFYFETEPVENLPEGVAVDEGSYVGIGIELSGSLPLDFLWEHSPDRTIWAEVQPGSDLYPEQTYYLEFASIPLVRSGWYRVTVSNDLGTTTTAGAQVQVLPGPPTIAGPAAVTVFDGDDAILSVSVQSSTEPSFRWEVFGFDTYRPLFDEQDGVIGSDTTHLTIPAASFDRFGQYRCVVTNGAGSFPSEPAQLDVMPAPAELELAPASIAHYVIVGTSFPAATIRLRNTGKGDLFFGFTGSTGETWFGGPNPTSGTVPPGGEQLVELAIVDPLLEIGAYETELSLSTNALGAEAVVIPLRLVVIDPYTVTTLADAGTGSLRERIALVNSTPGPQTIRFAVKGMIFVESELPPLDDATGGTTIQSDGATFINGARLRGPENGLVIRSANNIIDGLGIIRFPANGILVTGQTAQNNRVIRCLIGTNGTQNRGNLQSGIRLDGESTATTIGGENDLANTISGNSFSAVSIGSSSENVIQGNNLGTGVGGSGLIGNGGHGFHILPALSSNNTIGGTILFDANVIAGNKFQGGSLDVFVGRTVRLRALVHGSEAYDYQWFNEQGMVGDGQRELVLANIQKSDEGSYYCIVSNPAGDVESKRTFVNVIDRAEFAVLALLPAYANLDLNGDGVLSKDEINAFIAKSLGKVDKGADSLTDDEFDLLDIDKDGFLSYQELLLASGLPLEEVRYEVSPTTYLYPPADIDDGAAGPQTYIISNLDTQPLEILTTPTLTGPSAAEFSIVGGEGNSALAELEERTIIVDSDPALLNERVAYLTIQTDDFLLPIYQVLLSGYGVQSTQELLGTLLGTDTTPRQRGELDVNSDAAFDSADIQLNTQHGL